MNWFGLGIENLVIVKCGADGKMCPADLEKCIQKDIQNGRKPFFVNSTAGTTLLGAIDDIPVIANICRKYNIWLHVDVINLQI